MQRNTFSQVLICFIFRRICILKGIYPVEPKNKKKVNKGSTANKTYYYIKDIQYLAHEPILNKFREFKIFLRKLKKAIAKEEPGTAQKLVDNKPIYKLDHILKERSVLFVSFSGLLQGLEKIKIICNNHYLEWIELRNDMLNSVRLDCIFGFST